MRTTLDIDEDVLATIKDLAAAWHLSMGQVISKLARQGLKTQVAQTKRPKYRSGVPLFPSRGVVVTDAEINRIREQEGI